VDLARDHERMLDVDAVHVPQRGSYAGSSADLRALWLGA
jgi:hypothetical protein